MGNFPIAGPSEKSVKMKNTHVDIDISICSMWMYRSFKLKNIYIYIEYIWETSASSSSSSSSKHENSKSECATSNSNDSYIKKNQRKSNRNIVLETVISGNSSIETVIVIVVISSSGADVYSTSTTAVHTNKHAMQSDISSSFLLCDIPYDTWHFNLQLQSIPTKRAWLVLPKAEEQGWQPPAVLWPLAPRCPMSPVKTTKCHDLWLVIVSLIVEWVRWIPNFH